MRGNALSAPTAALTKNDEKPRLTPCFSWKASFRRARSASTAVMSISLKVVSIAAVCWASTRRLAIVALRLHIRTRSSRRAAAERLAGALGCSQVPEAARGLLVGPVRAPAATRCFRCSWCQVRRCCPGADELLHVLLRDAAAVAGAATLERSTPCSLGDFFAVGVAFTSATRRLVGSLRVARVGAGAWWLRASAASAVASAAAVLRSTPSTSPTLTSSPSLRSMRARTPADSALTSRSILSVSSSTSGSPAATASPSFFSQRATRASMTDSPNCGTTMSI